MTLHDHGTTEPAAGRDKPLRLMAAVVGATFLLVGVLGFVPGVTSGVGDMTFADHHSGAELLGVFQVSVLHNLVHLLFGVVGLVLARRASSAFLYLVAGGAVYFLLFATASRSTTRARPTSYRSTRPTTSCTSSCRSAWSRSVSSGACCGAAASPTARRCERPAPHPSGTVAPRSTGRTPVATPRARQAARKSPRPEVKTR